MLGLAHTLIATERADLESSRLARHFFHATGTAQPGRPHPRSWPDLQNPFIAARTRRVFATGLRLPQAKLPRNLNPVARRRVRRFESCMPSQTVGSPQPFAVVRAARCYAVTMQRSFSDAQEHARAVDKSAVPERRRRRFTASGVLVILARQCAQIRRSGRNGLSVAAANSRGRGARKDARDVRNTQWF